MIPSVQLLTNCQGVMSNLHRDALDKFVLPITPNSSPIGSNDQNLQADISVEQYEEQFDCNQSPIQHEEVFSVCYSDGKSIQYSENGVDPAQIELHGTTDGEQITCLNSENDEINYTIFGNGLIVNTLDCTEVEIDGEDIDENCDTSKKHEVLMQIDIPMIFCNTITPTTASNSMVTTVSSSSRVSPSPHETNSRATNSIPIRQSMQSINKIDNNVCHKIDQNAIRLEEGKTNEDNHVIINKSLMRDGSQTKPNQNGENCKRIKLNSGSQNGHNNHIDAENDNNNDDLDDNGDESSSERDLTNLSWLMCLKNIPNLTTTDTTTPNRKSSNGNSHTTTTNAISNCIIDDIDDDDICIEPIITDKDLSEERFKKFTVQVKQ